MLRMMTVVVVLSIGVSGCGVESAATAASIGAAKAEQAKAGKKAVQDVRAKLAAATSDRKQSS